MKKSENFRFCQCCTPFSLSEQPFEMCIRDRSLLGKYNENAASDLGTAAHSFRACAHGAWLNVVINVGSLKDKEKARSYQEKGAALLKESAAMADQIHQAILLSLV